MIRPPPPVAVQPQAQNTQIINTPCDLFSVKLSIVPILGAEMHCVFISLVSEFLFCAGVLDVCVSDNIHQRAILWSTF